MPNLLLGALKPTPTGATLLAAIVYAFKGQLQRSSYLKLFVLWLLFLNRGAFPLRWHIKLAAIFVKARVEWDVARLGFRKPTKQQREIGLTKGGELALYGIGRNVFEVVTERKTRVSFAESDYNLHLSNSNYAQAGDFARMEFASFYLGAPWAQDGILTLLGGTSFVYLREIPMFANYSTESRILAYDEKWCYFMTRFVIPYDKRSKRPPARSYATGKDCTVCAFLLSRLCFKRGRINVTPEKICAQAGMVGPTDATTEPLRNWEAAMSMRRKRQVKDWLLREDDAGQYIRGGEEDNAKALALIAKLHDTDRKIWLELDNLRPPPPPQNRK